MTAPARLEEPDTVTIDAVGHDGRGIASVDGKKVFVADVLRGERVQIRRRRRRRHYDEAELVQVLEPAAHRRVPQCAVFGTCGGCSLQHVSAEEQRAIKQQTLENNLARIAGILPARWLPPLHAPDDDGHWRYRRKARLAVKDVPGKGRVLVGFRERHVPYVTDMRRCETLAPPVDSLIEPLSELVAGLDLRRRLPQVEVAVADNATELVFRVLDPPAEEDRQRLTRFATEHGVQVSLQHKGPDTVERLAGDRSLYYELPEFGLKLEFEATDFVQVNAEVNRQLVATVVELLEVSPGQRVLDLFCGIGNFSLPLATRAGRVLGIEGAARQVERARSNAAANGLDNCEFRTADLADPAASPPWGPERWDRLLLDPARSGAGEVMRRIREIDPARVVYVSCHPATLARDVATLAGQGSYRFEAAGIADMFPHTAHSEALAVFSKL